MVVNGPINMKLGDTAEVVLGMVAALGTNNIDAVNKMKTNDNSAQIVFDQLFQLPVMPVPVVKVEQLDQKIVLNWGNDLASVNEIENFSGQGYDFEGYDRTIDAHVKNLRHKIEKDSKEPEFIKTVYGIGYKFTGIIDED